MAGSETGDALGYPPGAAPGLWILGHPRPLDGPLRRCLGDGLLWAPGLPADAPPRARSYARLGGPGDCGNLYCPAAPHGISPLGRSAGLVVRSGSSAAPFVAEYPLRLCGDRELRPMRLAVMRLLVILMALCIIIEAVIVMAGYFLALPGLSSWHIGGQMSFNTALLLIGVGIALLLLALLTEAATWHGE